MNLEEECYRVDLQLVGPKDGYQLLLRAVVSGLGVLTRPINLLVDTGSALPLLLKKSDAIQLQVRIRGESSSIIGLSLRSIKSIRLNRRANIAFKAASGEFLRFPNIPVEVLDFPHKKRGGYHRDLSWSLVGLPFLRKYNMLVDMRGPCLWIPKKQG